MTIFAIGTRELLTDTAIAALNDGRAADQPDFATREDFVRAAGVAFDAIAADLDDADPECQRPEFLG